MNKRLVSFVVMGGLVAAAALAGCNGGSSTTKQDIYMQLVPSNDPVTLMKRATALEPILNKYETGFSFHISVGTTYAATTTALVNGQIDGGFLTSAGYAQTTEQNPGKVDLLYTAQRDAYKVAADDFPGSDAATLEKVRKAMNGEINAKGTAVAAGASDAYSYHGEQSTKGVTYYNGVIISRRDSYSATISGAKKLDLNNDGTISLKELHDAKAVVGHMGASSVTGFITAYKCIYDAGYTLGFKTKDAYDKLSAADQEKAIIGVDQGSYPAAVTSLMDGTIDAACGFFDIRYGSAYVQADSKWKGNNDVFDKTYTVAVTESVQNDTISVFHDLAADKRAAIKDGFAQAIKDGATTDATTGKVTRAENSGSWLLYQIYSHTGYVEGKDSDYDSSRALYEWQAQHAN
jgi:ABC-type phosphate/phosphonate transport system substrate-binding protein